MARLAMRRLLANDPSEFTLAAADLAGEPLAATAAEAVAGMLSTQPGVIEFLCDPRMLDLASALALARLMATSSHALDVQLAQRIQDSPGRDWAVAYRALELIGEVSDGHRIQLQLLRLCDDPDKRIRSKVALLAGRLRPEPSWISRFLRDPDPRVRANAVEAMWDWLGVSTLEHFEFAAVDRHHRVAANAIVGLHRRGEPVVARLDRMLRNEEPMFQAAGAWASGECGAVSMLPLLQDIASAKGPARRSALRAMVRLRGAPRTPSTEALR